MPIRDVDHIDLAVSDVDRSEEELPGYYTFFVFDLDGIRIELNHWSDQMRKQWDEGVHLEIEP